MVFVRRRSGPSRARCAMAACGGMYAFIIVGMIANRGAAHVESVYLV